MRVKQIQTVQLDEGLVASAIAGTVEANLAGLLGAQLPCNARRK